MTESNPMLTLIIKARDVAAAKCAAYANGIHLVDPQPIDNLRIRAFANKDMLPIVESWFYQEAECEQGRGYPEGTLLSFSNLTPK